MVVDRSTVLAVSDVTARGRGTVGVDRLRIATHERRRRDRVGVATTFARSGERPHLRQRRRASTLPPQPSCSKVTGGPFGAAQRSPHAVRASTTGFKSRPLSVGTYSCCSACSG